MIPITSIVKNPTGSWTFFWNSTSPTGGIWRVVLWGKEIARINNVYPGALSYIYNSQDYRTFPPPLEIVTGQEFSLSEQFLPFLVVQWYKDDGAKKYLVQKKVGLTWSTVSTIQDDGSWVFTYNSPLLTDEKTYDYRVISVDSVDNKAPARNYERYVVCPPQPPDSKTKVNYSIPNIIVAAR